MTNATSGVEAASRMARRIRADCLRMTHDARSSHLGSCLSVADILAVLYSGVVRHDPTRPKWEQRDRVIISKGHAAAAVYATLAGAGYFPRNLLKTFYLDGSSLPGHVSHRHVPGVEVSTGSLGHGLAIAAGMTLAARMANKPHRIFVVMSDGELDEGSTWEAVLFAGHHRLSNLTAIVDYNRQQAMGATERVLNLDPLDEKFRSFGWDCRPVDGHSHADLIDVLSTPRPAGSKPLCVIARTVKGKGVQHMENQLLWHYRYPREEDLLLAAESLGCEI